MAFIKNNFLLVKGKAGLGNRMLCALTGILYSRLAKRGLVMDWGDVTYSDDGSNVFPKLFDCPDYDLSLPVPDTESVSPALWRGRLKQTASQVVTDIDPAAHDSQRRYLRFSADLSNLEHPERVLVLCSFSHRIPTLRRHFHGEFSHLASRTDEQILAEMLRDFLTPRPEIRSHVTKWRDRNFDRGRMIGVHVRFMERRTSIDWFFRDVDKIAETIKDPIIFLATDNKDAENAFRNRYKTVIATEKWFPVTGISMHQNPECPDKLKNAIEALTDMYLLAECDYLVFPGSSTFSYISSLVTDMTPDRIFDVERRDLLIQAKKLARRLTR